MHFADKIWTVFFTQCHLSRAHVGQNVNQMEYLLNCADVFLSVKNL